MYIDENCFLPLKMEEMFAIAASFVKIVRNRGFSPRALSGSHDYHRKITRKSIYNIYWNVRN